MNAAVWARRVLVAFAVLLILVSFLPEWQTDHWWVRQWDYPRLQVAALIVQEKRAEDRGQ